MCMNDSDQWKTIKTINIPERETPIRVMTKPINLNDSFPEYRIYIGSSHIERHLNISYKEILTSSETKKAKCYTIINYYGMQIDAKLQEKV